jgi:serine protease Do/serine protease DegQ
MPFGFTHHQGDQTMLFRLRNLFFIVIIGFALSLQASLPKFDSQDEELPTLSPMIKKVAPAVVNIATYSTLRQNPNPLLNDPFFRRFFDVPPIPRQQPQQRRQQSAGSGVIVDADKGIVMTNYHVVKGADEVMVSLVDGRHFQAEILGSDPDLDIAILKIKAEKLVELKLADSDKLEVGDFVVAIGNPFGLGQTVTTGIVSALGRTGLGIEGYENFIQTDASINPGNSGGALVNLRGELVGINTAIIAPAGGNVGIGFAIPINMAKASMQQILEHGEVRRGQIGIGIQDVSPELREAFDLDNGESGVLITHVSPNSPAEKAGLKAGDIIIAVDGEPTRSTGQLRSQIGMRSVGDKVKLTIIRDGKQKTIKVTVGEPQELASSQGRLHPLFEGVQLENTPDNEGVLVARIAPSSPAAFSGLRPGDVIVSANRKPVTDLASLKRALEGKPSTLLLRVNRDGGSLFIVIR